VIHLISVAAVKSSDITILPDDKFVCSAMIRQGIMPSCPISPSVGITTECLELYRIAHLRSPHLSIQPWVKTLCDIHGVSFNLVWLLQSLQLKNFQVQFKKHLSRQFSIAFDLYLQIRSRVDQRVQAALNRDSPDWRLRHACPACTYKLKDEAPLVFKMLYTIDGNDSLKRVLRREVLEEDDDENVGPSSELPSTQKVDGDYYLSREEVDKWVDGVVQEMMGDETDIVSFYFILFHYKNRRDRLTAHAD